MAPVNSKAITYEVKSPNICLGPCYFACGNITLHYINKLSYIFPNTIDSWKRTKYLLSKNFWVHCIYMSQLLHQNTLRWGPKEGHKYTFDVNHRLSSNILKHQHGTYTNRNKPTNGVPKCIIGGVPRYAISTTPLVSGY
jgi:hypothetical protein